MPLFCRLLLDKIPERGDGCEGLVGGCVRRGLTCTGSLWTGNAGERIEGSPNCHTRDFGRVAYLTLEWVVEHEADKVSGSKNQPPTLSLPGIRLHLTLRALQVGRLTMTVSGVRTRGRPRTCRHHTRCFASGAEAEESLPVRACGSVRTERAGPGLDGPDVKVGNRNMQKKRTTGAVRGEVAGQHRTAGQTDG